MDEFRSLTVVTIDEDGVGGRRCGDEAAGERIKMEECEGERFLEALEERVNEKRFIIRRLEEEEAFLDVVRREQENIPRG